MRKYIVVSLIFSVIFISCSISVDSVDKFAKSTDMYYYGRSLLTDYQLKAYQYIMEQSWVWDDSESTSTGDPLKTISFENTGILITQEELLTILIYLKQDNVELYNTRPTARYSTLDSKGYVIDFKFRYDKFPNYSEFKSNEIIINKKINEILSKISSDMTDAQKIKVVHDELLKLVRYSLNASSKGVADIRGAFIDFLVLCDGYAQALHLLFQKLGLESIYIVGNTHNEDGTPIGLHAWNKVKLDGSWYNIDPTWNDPLFGSGIEVLYDYFLISDKEFSKTHTPNKGKNDYPLPEGSLTSYPFDKTIY